MKRFMLAVVLGIVAVTLIKGERSSCRVVAQEPGGDRREAAEGLPVPIYPGTRVTEAELSPPRAPINPAPPETRFRRVAPPVTTERTIAGRLSATEERARDDARTQLAREVADWLAPDVPPTWKVPSHLLAGLVVETRVKPIAKDYGTVFEAIQRVDFSPPHRAEILAAYQGDLVRHRLLHLAAVLGFILVSLASLSGYIRADEATKGYYTPWLRTIAAGSVGAAGVVIYQLLA